MAVGDPVRIVAPTVVRIGMTTGVNGNRHAVNISDVSLDAAGGSRADFIAHCVPLIVKAWQNDIVGHYGPGLGFIGATWIDLDSLDGGSGFQTPDPTAPTTGTDSNVLAPPNVALLIHKNTITGRGHRQGRWFLPSVAEGKVDAAGVVEGATRVAWETNANAYRLAIEATASGGGTSAKLRVVHVHKGVKDDPATWTWSSSDVGNCTVDAVVATSRRRLRA